MSHVVEVEQELYVSEVWPVVSLVRHDETTKKSGDQSESWFHSEEGNARDIKSC